MIMSIAMQAETDPTGKSKADREDEIHALKDEKERLSAVLTIWNRWYIAAPTRPTG